LFQQEKNMKAIFAAAVLLAMAVASPALAQSAQDGGQRYSGGTYHGYPTSEWYRQDSW
jgi:ABC-type sugar transport system substrate-binding protein